MRQIAEYDIVDDGIENCQYWQGVGVAFTKYEYVATGIGDNFAEALDDCLECMAQGDETDGIDFEAFNKQMLADEGLEAWPTEPSVSGLADKVSEGESFDESFDEHYYYVSIRYNVADVEEGK